MRSGNDTAGRAARDPRCSSEREREGRHGDAVSIVRMDDLGPQAFHQTGQPPRRREVHLRARGERDELEAFRGAPPQLAVRMSDQRRAMPDFPQAVDGEQDLVLATTPRPRGIDMKREHIRQLCITKLRKTRRKTFESLDVLRTLAMQGFDGT